MARSRSDFCEFCSKSEAAIYGQEGDRNVCFPVTKIPLVTGAPAPRVLLLGRRGGAVQSLAWERGAEPPRHRAQRASRAERAPHKGAFVPGSWRGARPRGPAAPGACNEQQELSPARPPRGSSDHVSAALHIFCPGGEAEAGVVERDELCSRRPLLALGNVCSSQPGCGGTARRVRAVRGAALAFPREERHRKVSAKPRVTLQSLRAHRDQRRPTVAKTWAADLAAPFFSRCCSVWREGQPPGDGLEGADT